MRQAQQASCPCQMHGQSQQYAAQPQPMRPFSSASPACPLNPATPTPTTTTQPHLLKAQALPAVVFILHERQQLLHLLLAPLLPIIDRQRGGACSRERGCGDGEAAW